MNKESSPDTSVDDMNYMDLIGLIGETNRPPGGLDSVIRLVQQTLLAPTDHVLEVGTSTGFTAIELARLVGCEVTGIDLNEESLSKARDRAAELGVTEMIDFERADVTDLPYSDETFDMVCIGNVTSYVSDRKAAVAEAARTLKKGGFLAALPMYYYRSPSSDLLDEVSKAVGNRIEQTDKEYWVDLFETETLRQHHVSEFKFEFVSEAEIERYIKKVISQRDLSQFTAEQRDQIKQMYRSYLLLFRENLQHLRHALMIYRKETTMEHELFSSTPI